MPTYDEIAIRLGEHVPFAQHNRITILSVGDGLAEAAIDFGASQQNHLGMVHAGALFSLAETTSGAAIAGCFNEQLDVIAPLAIRASIEFLRPIKSTATAVATVTRTPEEMRSECFQTGSTSGQVVVSVSDSRDREVATLNVDWTIKYRPRKSER